MKLEGMKQLFTCSALTGCWFATLYFVVTHFIMVLYVGANDFLLFSLRLPVYNENHHSCYRYKTIFVRVIYLFIMKIKLKVQ